MRDILQGHCIFGTSIVVYVHRCGKRKMKARKCTRHNTRLRQDNKRLQQLVATVHGKHSVNINKPQQKARRADSKKGRLAKAEEHERRCRMSWHSSLFRSINSVCCTDATVQELKGRNKRRAHLIAQVFASAQQAYQQQVATVHGKR